jgi:hypothetical protein
VKDANLASALRSQSPIPKVKMSTQDLPTPHLEPDRSASNEEPLDEKPQYEEVTTFSDPLPLSKDGTNVYASSISDVESIALRKNPFLDADVATHWSTIYEKSRYECRHVFDPAFTWTDEEERKLVRRLDWRVCFWAVSLVTSQTNRSLMSLVYHVFRSPS